MVAATTATVVGAVTSRQGKYANASSSLYAGEGDVEVPTDNTDQAGATRGGPRKGAPAARGPGTAREAQPDAAHRWRHRLRRPRGIGDLRHRRRLGHEALGGRR